jgi:hypothetical protein
MSERSVEGFIAAAERGARVRYVVVVVVGALEYILCG